MITIPQKLLWFGDMMILNLGKRQEKRAFLKCAIWKSSFFLSFSKDLGLTNFSIYVIRILEHCFSDVHRCLPSFHRRSSVFRFFSLIHPKKMIRQYIISHKTLNFARNSYGFCAILMIFDEIPEVILALSCFFMLF